MISKLRLEAEAATLEEVLRDIENALPPKEKLRTILEVHDEHYERVGETHWRGRRVLGVGPKPDAASAWKQTYSSTGPNTMVAFTEPKAA